MSAKAIRKDPTKIANVKKQTYELALAAVSSQELCYPDVLPLIDPKLLAKHPDLYTVAMKNRPMELEHVPNAYITRELCLDALSRHGLSIHLFESPDEEMYVKAVEGRLPLKEVPVEMRTPTVCNAFVLTSHDAIRNVQQTPELCLAAVKKWGAWALQYVEQQTPEICRAAVDSDRGFTLEYVKPEFLTPELCLAAVKKGESIKTVPQALRTYEMCLMAVSRVVYQDEFAYVPAEMRTPELCLAYVKSKGTNVRNIPMEVLVEHPEIAMAAVQKDPFALRLIPKDCQTPELCMAAIKGDPRTFVYIHQQTPELLMAMATHPRYHLVVEQMTH